MSHIVELQRELMENRGAIRPDGSSNSSSTSKYYRPRTASVQQQRQERNRRDAIELLELGDSPNEIANLLGISMSEVLKAQEYSERRRKYLMTLDPRYL